MTDTPTPTPTPARPRVPVPERIASSLERIAHALEIITREGWGVEPRPEPMTAAEESDLEARDDSSSMIDEETMAVIELIEQSGRSVPLEVYARLGIDPPNRRETAVDESAFDEPQPGSHPIDEEIRTYRRKLNAIPQEEPTE
jgi:hypothetical protein